jgi:hypothetical protein
MYNYKTVRVLHFLEDLPWIASLIKAISIGFAQNSGRVVLSAKPL